AESRQNARAAHHDAGIGLADPLVRGALLEVEHPAGGTAPLKIDTRVGQGQVTLADVFVVAPDVLAELGPAPREVARGCGPGGERDVHEAGRAAHQASGRPSPSK